MAKFNEAYYKQKIGWYRHLFTVFAAINIGCIAWFVTNFGKTYDEFISLDILAIIVTSSILIIIISKVIKYIKLLRE